MMYKRFILSLFPLIFCLPVCSHGPILSEINKVCDPSNPILRVVNNVWAASEVLDEESVEKLIECGNKGLQFSLMCYRKAYESSPQCITSVSHQILFILALIESETGKEETFCNILEKRIAKMQNKSGR